jgi:phosphate transport system protein
MATPEPRSVPELRHEYDERLAEVRTDVIRLGALAEEAVQAGTRALLDADLELVDRVISSDEAIDRLCAGIEERVYGLIALQQPLATDLRTLLAILRITQELELTGDLMVSVAKNARRLWPHELPPKIRGLLERMGEQAGVQLHAAIDAFVDGDHTLAAALADMDDVLDGLQTQLYRVIFAAGAADERALHQAVTTALLGRFYERVGDHAVQIARWADFIITGRLPRHAPENAT